ncbi:SAM-dependent methyltransferase [Actinomadura litoris]|uniref:S-adenosyl methyltransferase n=1 Tax=Actinomadura litoris TaxID=2678616 RepID=A0A7K1LB60_9ACTN|nr:SAM-dependent methyltransferase [Actinomadura litoris]MUN41658.1 hypothetical protein [Actinomadura litoris]
MTGAGAGTGAALAGSVADGGARTPRLSMARVWAAWAGDPRSFAPEQGFGARVLERYPQVAQVAARRVRFGTAAVRAMLAEHGIEQLLVADADLPPRARSHHQVHQVVQAINPRARTVYASGDPMVIAALTNAVGKAGASCAFVAAGLESWRDMLNKAFPLLDLRRPVGVVLINSLDPLPGDQAAAMLQTLRGVLATGSVLALCHLTGDPDLDLALQDAAANEHVTDPPTVRSPATLEALTEGMDDLTSDNLASDTAPQGVTPEGTASGGTAPGVEPRPHRDLPTPQGAGEPTVGLWCALLRVPVALPEGWAEPHPLASMVVGSPPAGRDWASGSIPTDWMTARVGPERPNWPRMWQWWLGGADGYAADQHAARVFAGLVPGLVAAVRRARRFQARLVRHLAQQGLTQFLDVGVGLPVPGDTLQVARQVTPHARVVFLDRDPVVMAHARALLAGDRDDQGGVGFVEADAADTAAVLDQAAATLDLDRPVAVLLLNILHGLDREQARAVVTGLAAPLAPGSHLAIADLTCEGPGEAIAHAIRAVQELGADPILVRPAGDLADLLGGVEGLRVLDPVMPVARWRPDLALDEGPWPAWPARPAARDGRDWRERLDQLHCNTPAPSSTSDRDAAGTANAADADTGADAQAEASGDVTDAVDASCVLARKSGQAP